MRSPVSWKRPKFPVSSSDTSGWQLPDSIILRTSSSEPCPPSTYCSTTTRASVPNSLYQGLTFSGLTGAQLLGLSPPGGSHHYSSKTDVLFRIFPLRFTPYLPVLLTLQLVSRFRFLAPPRFL
ncbi:hypothetical protein AMECASPLE_033092 [Ameca splendens]|uniref:Uncharacterized protein n=1 Tax=Ameca splendens TaxID=208324 RepID=A0ABV0ZG05_9TELE